MVIDFDPRLVVAGGGDEGVVVEVAGVLAVVGDEVLRAGEGPADALNQFDVAVRDEDGLAVADVEHVGELFVLRPVVQGDEADAEHGAGVVGEHVVGGVDRHGGDLLAALHTEGGERVGQLHDQRVHLRVGDALVVSANLNQRLPVGHDGRRDLQELDGIQ